MDDLATTSLVEDFRRVRAQTLSLCSSLRPEDTVVQSMPDASPTKWHLAHVTWFFERFVLEPFAPDYRRFNERYDYLFNSYYYSVGRMHPRPQRGLLSRPTLDEVRAYRSHVDDAMAELLAQRDEKSIRDRVVLGLNHEQQHQELLLTDIKHVLSCNPLQPAMATDLVVPEVTALAEHSYLAGAAGLQRVGGEFVTSGGYSDSNLWLADGWAVMNDRGWNRPLYWSEDLQAEFTLGGLREMNDAAPVCHVSYYEADAFARWVGARLPTEFEWEVAAGAEPPRGNLMESRSWHPAAAGDASQFFGDVWEWTSSPYAPYPGFKPLDGSLGEYNGKFMCNQMTVRGGSCVTAADHIRASYRSFFYPDARWQFLGIRLAKDGMR
jgi:formylglycine-generating enzyme required for sulfatase activity